MINEAYQRFVQYYYDATWCSCIEIFAALSFSTLKCERAFIVKGTNLSQETFIVLVVLYSMFSL